MPTCEEMEDLIRGHEERLLVGRERIQRREAKLRELDEEYEFLPEQEKGGRETIGWQVHMRRKSIQAGLVRSRRPLKRSESTLKGEYAEAAAEGCAIPRALAKRTKGFLVLGGLLAVGAGGALALRNGRR